jgi:hypothetical protein
MFNRIYLQILFIKGNIRDFVHGILIPFTIYFLENRYFSSSLPCFFCSTNLFLNPQYLYSIGQNNKY